MAHSTGVMGPKKECGWVVHRSGPAVENRSTHSIRRLCSWSNRRSLFLIRLLSVGILRRMGSSPKTDFFAILPKIRPAKLRGGELNPAAISSHAEQCDIICATFIAPHCFWLSGLRHSIRFLISIAEEASNRFFTVFSSKTVSSAADNHSISFTVTKFRYGGFRWLFSGCEKCDELSVAAAAPAVP